MYIYKKKKKNKTSKRSRQLTDFVFSFLLCFSGKLFRREIYELGDVTRVESETKRVENTLEDEDAARQPEHSFLLVAVFLRGFVEELDEDGVVEELGAHDEALHLVADVDRDVPLRNHRRGGAADLGWGGETEGLGAWAAVVAGLGGVRTEERVVGGVSHAREAADELLHLKENGLY